MGKTLRLKCGGDFKTEILPILIKEIVILPYKQLVWCFNSTLGSLVPLAMFQLYIANRHTKSLRGSSHSCFSCLQV